MGKIKLAASNIGWAAADDERVWRRMQALGYSGLEIAPTRVFPERPYDNLPGVSLFAGVLWQQYGLAIASMQSIWYGQSGNIFVPDEAEPLAEYTEAAFAFAAACRCGNLVFGCPRNRSVPQGHSPEEAEPFFARLAASAYSHGTCLALEANPPLYGTNYLNTTAQTLALAKKLNAPGLGINLDMGTIVQNGENLLALANEMQWVNHIHISEPGLAPLQPRPQHAELAQLLDAVGYTGYVSLEMKTSDYDTVNESLTYLAEVFA